MDFFEWGMFETVFNAKPHHSAEAFERKLTENGRDYLELQCVPTQGCRVADYRKLQRAEATVLNER